MKIRALVWVFAVLALLAGLAQALAQGPIFKEQSGYLITARVSEEAGQRSLRLRALKDGQGYKGVVHAYFVSRDRNNLYFEYPEDGSVGEYSLELPEMRPGIYDLILEVTGGNGHNHDKPDFVQFFELGVEGRGSDEHTRLFERLILKPTVPNLRPAGQPSGFEFTTTLDGAPVAWGEYYVHQFFVSIDNAYFKHDHPGDASRKLGVGSVESKFSFAKPGQYVAFVFLESGVRIDGRVLRPVLRYPSMLEVR